MTDNATKANVMFQWLEERDCYNINEKIPALATYRQLGVGESTCVILYASNLWTRTSVIMKPGEAYNIEFKTKCKRRRRNKKYAPLRLPGYPCGILCGQMFQIIRYDTDAPQGGCFDLTHIPCSACNQCHICWSCEHKSKRLTCLKCTEPAVHHRCLKCNRHCGICHDCNHECYHRCVYCGVKHNAHHRWRPACDAVAVEYKDVLRHPCLTPALKHSPVFPIIPELTSRGYMFLPKHEGELTLFINKQWNDYTCRKKSRSSQWLVKIMRCG